MSTAVIPRIVQDHPALETLKTEMADIEAKVAKFSLADAIRYGSSCTDQAYTWRQGDNLCALSAAALAVTARKA